jgi:hypothetical protein
MLSSARAWLTRANEAAVAAARRIRFNVFIYLFFHFGGPLFVGPFHSLLRPGAVKPSEKKQKDRTGGNLPPLRLTCEGHTPRLGVNGDRGKLREEAGP